MKRNLHISIMLIIYLTFVAMFQPAAASQYNGINIIVVDEECSFYYLESDVSPILKEDTTLVPLRAIAETFGFSVVWDETDQSIHISKESKQIALQIGSVEANIDSRTIELPIPPELLNGRTLVPVRTICEFFEINVEWVEGIDGYAYIWLSALDLLNDEDFELNDDYYAPDEDIPYYVLCENKSTARNIKIGDDYEDVVGKYGVPHKVSVNEDAMHIKYYSLAMPNSEVHILNFFLENRKVVNVAIE